jgi:hypothetical protein
VATFENTVMITRSIEDVFGFLSDFENVPRWNYTISETHKVSEGPVHDLIVDSPPSARKLQATAERHPRTQPMDLRARSVPVRATAVAHGNQRSIAVANGSGEPRATGPPAYAAEMT